MMKEKNIDYLLDYDRDHIWHPYTSAKYPLPVYLVDSASGVYLHLQDGKKLIDGMSSWWAVVHGYNHPSINAALQEQMTKMSHVMFGGLTHEPAIELAQRLISMTPDSLEHVFFCDSGSVAVEVAMKMALQYWHSRSEPRKCQFATIRSGYHGDTWHTMSVCDPETGMHHIFNNRLPMQYFVPEPQVVFGSDWDPADLSPMISLVEEYASDLAAIILEPIVQGAGGMRFYHPEYLKGVRKLCNENNILLIADEIATGFGRTGKMFACEWADITPDIMCLGKAITGGYLSFAATLASTKVAETISEGNPGVFMHGPTFMGNPLACAAANASLQLMQTENILNKVQKIESRLKSHLKPAIEYNNVKDVRILGAIGVIEMKENVNMQIIQKQFVDEGIWVRPFGKLVYIMPPYIISEEELSFLCTALLKVVSQQ